MRPFAGKKQKPHYTPVALFLKYLCDIIVKRLQRAMQGAEGERYRCASSAKSNLAWPCLTG